MAYYELKKYRKMKIAQGVPEGKVVHLGKIAGLMVLNGNVGLLKSGTLYNPDGCTLTFTRFRTRGGIVLMFRSKFSPGPKNASKTFKNSASNFRQEDRDQLFSFPLFSV